MERTINRAVASIICGMTATMLFAQQRTLSEAASIAHETLLAHSKTEVNKIKAVSGNLLEMAIGLHHANATRQRQMPSFVNQDRQPFYVFNDESAQSFVIVAGDERMGDVLGYSTSSSFMADNLPDGLVGLLQFYAETYAEVNQSTPQLYAPHKTIEWQNVSYLVDTKWGQGAPYNNDCPVHQNKNSLVGCGATAMAQVMRYHQWPQTGRGSFSYISKTANLQQSMDFSTVTFNWSNMKNKYSSNETAPDVALLSHACGVSIAMDYTYNNSFAYIVDIPYALIEYFGYSSDVVCYRKEFFKPDAWASVLQRELVEGRPVIFRGTNASDNNGHLFVVDGCTDKGFLHVNWGWYGNSDGYFKIDNFVAGNSDHSYGQFIVAKISPTDLGEPEDVFFANEFSAEHQSYYTAAHLSGVYNYNSKTCLKDLDTRYNGMLGVGLYDAKGKSLGVLGGYQVSLSCTWGYSNFNIAFKDDEIKQPDGIYTIKPVAVNGSSNLISPIRTLNGETDSLFLVISDGKVDVYSEAPVGIVAPKTTTGIKTNTYTLDGRRVNSPDRNGLYIRNGRKELLRSR